MWLILLLALSGTASAGIVEGEKKTAPSSGIAVPKSTGPRLLECWIDGRRQVVEIQPGQIPPAVSEHSTRVIIRDGDGNSSVVVVPGAGASGCMPLR